MDLFSPWWRSPEKGLKKKILNWCFFQLSSSESHLFCAAGVFQFSLFSFHFLEMGKSTMSSICSSFFCFVFCFYEKFNLLWIPENANIRTHHLQNTTRKSWNEVERTNTWKQPQVGRDGLSFSSSSSFSLDENDSATRLRSMIGIGAKGRQDSTIPEPSVLPLAMYLGGGKPFYSAMTSSKWNLSCEVTVEHVRRDGGCIIAGWTKGHARCTRMLYMWRIFYLIF